MVLRSIFHFAFNMMFVTNYYGHINAANCNLFLTFYFVVLCGIYNCKSFSGQTTSEQPRQRVRTPTHSHTFLIKGIISQFNTHSHKIISFIHERIESQQTKAFAICNLKRLETVAMYAIDVVGLKSLIIIKGNP